MAPQSSTEWIFTGGDWLCWDVGPALFRKVTLLCVSEVFCGPQMWRRLKKVVNYFSEKSAPLDLLCPQCPAYTRLPLCMQTSVIEDAAIK